MFVVPISEKSNLKKKEKKMDLENLITCVLTGFQRQVETCRIELNNKLNHQ